MASSIIYARHYFRLIVAILFDSHRFRHRLPATYYAGFLHAG